MEEREKRQKGERPFVSRLDAQTVCLVLAMKIFLLVFVVIAYAVLMNRAASFPHGWLELWNRWDAPHYIDIARDGYVTEDVHSQYQRFWIVFYPLYPWMIRAVALIARDYVVSAHIVSLVGAVAMALLFERLVELDFDRTIARSAVVFMFIFPTAYFFHAGYTESLFMALALACVLAARVRRWSIAAIFGALASLTRVNGLLLVPVMAVEAIAQYRNEGRRFERGWLWIPVGSLGFIIYLWINDHVWNDPFHFQQVLAERWSRRLTWPWVGIARNVSLALRLTPARAQLFGTQEFLFVMLGLTCTIWCWRRLRTSYAVWMTLNWLLITSTSVVTSTPRYMLSFFPIFLLFALLNSERPLVGTLVTIWSMSFLALFTTLFGLGQWAF